MAESRSPPLSPQSPPKIDMDSPISPLRHIPVEIVSDEEMAIIEAAFTAARSSSSSLSSFLSLSRFRPSIHSISLISNRSLSSGSASANEDIEDIGENRRKETPLQRYRKNRGLAVTDFTSTEWCEKQKEFSLMLGKPEVTKAMKAGIARHTELEEGVLEREKIRTKTTEDIWALKFMNFMTGANQLLFDGLTRELPVIGIVEGVWMVGVIDEIRLPVIAPKKNPTLVDTKTRVQATLPSEAQRRNGR